MGRRKQKRRSERKQHKQERSQARNGRKTPAIQTSWIENREAGQCKVTRYVDGTYSYEYTDWNKTVGTRGTGSTVTSTSYTAKKWTCSHWQDEFDLGHDQKVLVSESIERIYSHPNTVVPDLGFYLDHVWASGSVVSTPGVEVPWTTNPGYPRIIFPWADASEPANVRRFDAAIDWLQERIQAGLTIDVGCIGAHGRTGTLLAALLIRKGMVAKEAVHYVRQNHCWQAVETLSQEKFLDECDHRWNGRALPQPVYALNKPAIRANSGVQSPSVFDDDWDIEYGEVTDSARTVTGAYVYDPIVDRWVPATEEDFIDQRRKDDAAILDRVLPRGSTGLEKDDDESADYEMWLWLNSPDRKAV